MKIKIGDYIKTNKISGSVIDINNKKVIIISEQGEQRYCDVSDIKKVISF